MNPPFVEKAGDGFGPAGAFWRESPKAPLKEIKQGMELNPHLPLQFRFRFYRTNDAKEQTIDFAYCTSLPDFAHYSDVDNSKKTSEIP
jgi:hypothetical protein